MSGVYRRLLVVLVLAIAALPRVDLTVSGWFFEAPNRFPLRYAPLLDFIRRETPGAVVMLAVGLALVWIASMVLKRRLLGVDGRRGFYLLASLAIGPGLIVNTVLKEFWGRARPTTIHEFGGDLLFSPALLPSNQCHHNCSFVSGHAAAAFWAISFALLAPKRWLAWAMAAALACGGFMGFVRMAQGGHFLSDVVYAGALVFSVSWVLHRLILGRLTLNAAHGECEE